MKNEDKPINPIVNQNGYPIKGFQQDSCSGLTKLEYASIQAMNGMLSNYELIQDIKLSNPEYNDLPFHEGIAKASIRIAEELLKQLEDKK